MKTLKDFLDDPHHATLYGYQPCLLDCWSLFAVLANREVFTDGVKVSADLINHSVKDLPRALLGNIARWLLLISLPLGGFFVLGSLAYVFTYRPKVLQPIVAKRYKDLTGDLDR